MDFCKMLDYKEIPGSPPVHYIKTIKYVRDVGLFLSEVYDMGCGISVFHVEIPDGETIETIIEKFQNSEKIRNIATPVTRFPKSHPEFKSIRSIEHLGEKNCYMGFFHCGAGEVDKYRFLVCSYDMQSSLLFHRRITKQIEKTFEKVKTQKDFMKTESYKVPAPALTEGSQYMQSIYRGYLNRRVVAARVFDILGILYDKEEYKDEHFQGKITNAVQAHEVLENYDIVFLRKKESYAQFFNRCIKTQDLYNGAPWFLAPHRGYYSFYQSGTNTNDFKEMLVKKEPQYTENGTPPLNVFVPEGAPLGIPRGFVDSSESLNIQQEKQIINKIIWNSDMSIMMYADPKLFHSLEQSFKDLEVTYNLGIRRYHLWKTLAMYVSPPDPNVIKLRIMVKFSTKATIRVLHLNYREVDHMYHTILNYIHVVTEKESKEIFTFPDRLDKSKNIKWNISMLPKMSELYKNQSDDLMETFMDVEMLHRLIHAFDVIEIAMQQKLETSGIYMELEHPELRPNARDHYAESSSSDFSDFEISAVIHDSDAPSDETSRDRPAKSINYNRAHIPSSGDEKLGDPDMEGSSSAVSDIDSTRVRNQYRMAKKIDEKSKYRQYMQKIIGNDFTRSVSQETETETEFSQAEHGKINRKVNGDESAAAKRRRRKKTSRDINIDLNGVNHYGNEFALTSEDDTISHLQ